MKETLLTKLQREARGIMAEYGANKMSYMMRDMDEFIANTLKQAVESLTDGAILGSDGTRNCYFIPMERIDTLTDAQKILGVDLPE